MPQYFKGLKPHTSEPWAGDAIDYATMIVPALRGDYNDECVLDSNNGYVSNVASAAGHNASLGAKDPWDDSPMRYCPHTLRGIKPVVHAKTNPAPWRLPSELTSRPAPPAYARPLQMTVEPWAVDQAVYNEDTLRDTTDEERAGGGDLEIAQTSYRDRALLRGVDRPGFYTPNWESWAAALSA